MIFNSTFTKFITCTYYRYEDHSFLFGKLKDIYSSPSTKRKPKVGLKGIEKIKKTVSKVSSAEGKSGDVMNREDTESLKLHKRTAILVSSQLIPQAIIHFAQKKSNNKENVR